MFLCLPPAKLDDEIAASVHTQRANMLDLDSIIELTSDNFHTEVAQSSLTVVLFYLRCKPHSSYCPVRQWEANEYEFEIHADGINFCFSPPGDAVSKVFLHSFMDVAERLGGKQEDVMILRPGMGS